ncbi:MAG TPA: hypothetical protein VIG99_22635 [Myxococcaceae bacterium]|jgi:hypothetical protein
MRLPLLSSALVVAMAGCAPPGGFDRISPFTLQLAVGVIGQTTVAFAYDQSHGCETLAPDLSVKMNDVEVMHLFRGGVVTPYPFGSAPQCLPPSAPVSRPGPFDQKATITATSGGDALLMEVEDVGAKLDAQPMLAPGEQVHVGQLVHLAVGPGFDRVQWPQSATATVHQGSAFIQAADVPISSPSAAGVLDLQLPGNLPSGTMHVTIDAITHPRVTRCEGPDACFVSPSMVVDSGVDLDVVP